MTTSARTPADAVDSGAPERASGPAGDHRPPADATQCPQPFPIRGVIGGTQRHETPAALAAQEAARALLESGGPLGLEVGFGYGTFMLRAAVHNPEARFLALEVRQRLVRLAREGAERRSVHNVAWLEGDARYLLPRLVRPSSLSQVWLLFPDPWWKERHWKKRGLVTRDFVGLLESLLRPGGVLTFKTDVRMRAVLMREVIEPMRGLVPTERDAIDPGPDATTKRQRRCRHEGVSYVEMRWRRELP